MKAKKTIEQQRLETQWSKKESWYKWGPYLSERQWGTVREDYSADGETWDYFPHEHARMRAYRWGEDGLGGISDDRQMLCFAVALWNGRDPFLKERLFGLSNAQGNHGEDVKELYYYLDNTPTHSFMRMLYKYPQAAFPYARLRNENENRTPAQAEFELLDTKLFNRNNYFDVFIEYAKNNTEDVLIRLTIHNRAAQEAPVHLLPTLWFRNQWAWQEAPKPTIERVGQPQDGVGQVRAVHEQLGTYTLSFQTPDAVLMTDNETNTERVFDRPNAGPFVKDAFHDAVTSGTMDPFASQPTGTKCAPVYALTIGAGQSAEVRLRLSRADLSDPLGAEFDTVFAARQAEADEFYGHHTEGNTPDDALIKRQAWAGLMWSKQYYKYNVRRWLEGDAGMPPPPPERWHGRNANWQHLDADHIMVMPDKWEYPWFAAWDQVFQAIAVEPIDLEFAKEQLYLHADLKYQASDGRLPAYEYDFSANNPPLRAAISWVFYNQERELTGKEDHAFLSTMFERLRPNYEWWTAQAGGNHDGLFQGGFLGLDNISLFDRQDEIPGGGELDQADATAWMATYSLYMMRIAVELAHTDPATHEPLACYYLDQYIRISRALEKVARLWIDDRNPESDNGFTYDVLHMPDGKQLPIPLRSMVGLANLFAVLTLNRETARTLPAFYQKIETFASRPPDKESCYCVINDNPDKEDILFALLTADQLRRLSTFLFSEDELLGPGGVRSLSKAYETPYEMIIAGEKHEIHYTPGESDSKSFGGNSNWRGPVWVQMNFFIYRALQVFGQYYGDTVEAALPTGSDNKGDLLTAAQYLADRMWSMFRPNENGERPVHGTSTVYATDPHFNELILFYEHFDGDTSRGLGASHQTGWTALITCV